MLSSKMLLNASKILAALSLALVLTACGASTGSGKARLDLSRAPTSPVHGCQQTTVLPSRDLSKAEVEAFWERDRVSLTKCFGNVEALLAYIAKLKAGFDQAPNAKETKS